ncbi:MAG: thiol protease/hemagglutinin PrtT [Bacteroidales bacterium]|nr:thiol protease/hemagglutinin PrtT [Bacteroidales bacterium]
MKKLSLLGLAMILFMGAAFAAPVDVNRAKSLGLKYVQNTLEVKTTELTLAYTETCDSGVEALYVFNYDQGYVVVAADDRAYPILGYCTDAQFDVNNIPEGLRYYLGHYARQIQYAIGENLAVEPEVAEQWYLLDKEGVIMKTRSDRAVAPLLSTTWNQDWPYNYYAPACQSYWTNNHCYAGCVATSMSQVMKYWNWPETGVGEHSYSTSSYGGTLSANFGATTYDWSIMPNSCSANNAASQAVALIMYHCGIAVDMDFRPDGSGSHTEYVPDAVINYFRYGSCTNLKIRDDFSRTAWEDMLIESFDQGIPVVYSGTDSDGGHAFNCDGYNDQRYFHFNWGWSGSYNNYYQIDALNTGNGNFNQYQRVVFEMVPDYVYDAMVPAIESLEGIVADAATHTVMINFTVPTESMSGASLQSVSSIVLKRDGNVIQTYSNVQPGEQFTLEDTVDEDGCYEYSICGFNNDIAGEIYKKVVLVGPNCTWKLIGQTDNFQGWNGGKLQLVDHRGVVFKEVGMTTSSPISEKFQMPEGEVQMNWVAPSTTVPSLTINLKNSANQSVYSYSGSSSQLNGTLFNSDNDCPSCTPPTNLEGEYQYENGTFGTLLTWNCDYDPSKYKIYRSDDGVEYTEIASIENTQREYFDEVAVGAYYYKVTAFSTACESTPAFTSDGTDYVFVTVTAVDEFNADAAIYPNPASESLSIKAADIQQVVLYNVVGQQVYRFQGSTDSLKVNTSSLEAGIYTVSVTTATGKTSRRIVVMH